MRLIDKEIGMREASKQAKISPATFSRLENGNTTDMDTFIKMCNWLKMSPSVFFKAATKQKNTI
jgi:DNA-binding Xre family transcriptional regulator